MNSNPEIKKQARQMLQANRFQEAKHLLEKILATEKADYECWYMLSTAHGRLGELADAERCSRQVISLAPDMPGGYIILGQALTGLNQFAKAEQCFKGALELDRKQPQAQLGLAVIMKAGNRFADAEAALREAIRMQPDFADAYSHLAIMQHETGRRSEALANYRQAAALMPGNTNHLLNLAGILRESGQLGEASNILKEVLELKPDHADAHSGLGMISEMQGALEEAAGHYKSALECNPAMTAIKRRLNMLYGRVIPGWHFPMLNDKDRNDAYDAALRKVVTPESVVLDIGSGSGLLAMMAARAGAKHVYTCEVKKPLAEKAREIVAENGYSDVITVISKKSTQLRIGEDMAEPADILVSEILDECLLGEGVIPSVHHARQNLLKDGAIAIPASSTIYAALVESESVYDYYCVNSASGFDVSAFNEFSRASYVNLRLPTFPHRVVTDAIETFSFDLSNPDPAANGEQDFSITVKENCTCHALVFWFRLDLDSELSVEASPIDANSHWMQAAQIQNPPVELKANDVVKVRGKFDNMSVRFSFVGLEN